MQSSENYDILFELEKGWSSADGGPRSRNAFQRGMNTYKLGGTSMDLMKELNKELLATEKPQVDVGDTVRVHVKIKEGSRERIQVFEGIVIAKKHGGIEETITVRRISYGIGVEKIFPLYSPSIDKIEVVRHGAVRRAKLYYLRDRVGKGAKVKEKL